MQVVAGNQLGELIAQPVEAQHIGVDRLVVGHTPVGDLPAVLRRDGFTLVMADNAYSRLEWGTRTEVDADHLTFTGRCRLDDGRELDVTATVADDEPVVGHVTATGSGR